MIIEDYKILGQYEELKYYKNNFFHLLLLIFSSKTNTFLRL